MLFNDHSKIAGQHAFLSASQYHWIRYTEDKLLRAWHREQAAKRGVALHSYAQMAIALGIRQDDTGQTLNSYINDAIGYQMVPEQVLYVSPNAFGTADAIGFKKSFLRIHDLKTGEVQSSMDQLYVYAAFFCMEYRFKPFEIDGELRIYQNDDIEVETMDPDKVMKIIDKITTFDPIIETSRREAGR